MNSLLKIVIFLVCTFYTFQSYSHENKEFIDEDNLQGVWLETAESTKANDIPPNNARSEIYVFEKGKLTVYTKNFNIQKSIYRISNGATNNAIDIAYENGDKWEDQEKYKNIRKGIYKFENNMLYICNSFHPNAVGPTEFCVSPDAKNGERKIYAVMKSFVKIEENQNISAIEKWKEDKKTSEKNMEKYIADVNKNLAEEQKAHEEYKAKIKSRELWSSTKSCDDNNALFIEITSFENSYIVAGCAPMGCRIKIKEYPGIQQNSYKNDPRIKWNSDSEIQLKIGDENKTLYLCKK